MSNNQNLSKMTHDFAQQLLEEKSLHEYDYKVTQLFMSVLTASTTLATLAECG